jgi:RimJ/RimL family protein N-acetyltransferase
MTPLQGRLKDVHLPLRTERLILREPVRSDAPALSRAGNDRRVARGTFVPFPFGPSQALAYLGRMRRRARTLEGLGLLVEHAESGKILGVVGLAFRPKDDAAEIFYWLSPTAWGQGFASEAVSKLIDLSFGPMRLHRLSARVISFNSASVRVLERAGFELEGRSREVRREGSRWQDELFFGLLISQYRSRGRRRGHPSRGSAGRRRTSVRG